MTLVVLLLGTLLLPAILALYLAGLAYHTARDGCRGAAGFNTVFGQGLRAWRRAIFPTNKGR